MEEPRSSTTMSADPLQCEFCWTEPEERAGVRFLVHSSGRILGRIDYPVVANAEGFGSLGHSVTMFGPLPPRYFLGMAEAVQFAEYCAPKILQLDELGERMQAAEARLAAIQQEHQRLEARNAEIQRYLSITAPGAIFIARPFGQ